MPRAQRARRRGCPRPAPPRARAAPRNHASCPGTMSPGRPARLEVGFRLVPLVDKTQSGDLLGRIRGVRRKLSQELGFLVQRSTSATTSNCPRTPIASTWAACPLARASSTRSANSRINPGRVFGKRPGHRDARSGLRHGGGLDRAGDARSRPDARLHGGRCQHGDRHPPEPHHPDARPRAARSRGSAAAARCRWPRPRRSWSRIWCRKRAAAGGRGARAAGPAGRARADPQSCAPSWRRWPNTPPAPGSGGAAGRRCASRSGRQIVQDIAGAGGELPVMTLEPDLERLLQSALNRSAPARRWNRAWPSGCRRGWRIARSDRKLRVSRQCCWWPRRCAPRWRASLALSVPGLHVLAWNEIPRQPQGAPGDHRRSLEGKNE